MQVLNDFEIGVMFWAGRDPGETLREVKALGVRSGQLAIPGDLTPRRRHTAEWKRALADEGSPWSPSSSPIPARTMRTSPPWRGPWAWCPRRRVPAREQRTHAVSDLAAALGVPAIATSRRLCPRGSFRPRLHRGARYCAAHLPSMPLRGHQVFALETGQEPAPALLEFFQDVDRPNLRINFDPPT